jgi:rare lipoprotein A
MSRPRLFSLSLIALAVAAVSSVSPAIAGETATAADKKKPAREARQRGVQTGLASFYARRLQGRETASGEPHDNQDFTAAHPSLAFGTRVKVTNLENDRTATVRITDRGPSRQNRKEGVIIDLSRAAATELQMKEEGRVKVRVEVVSRGGGERRGKRAGHSMRAAGPS